MNRPARARISLSNLAHNCTQVRRLAPHCAIMAVLKADAYGHGALPCARTLQAHADALAVATVGEAGALRAHGIRAPLVVLHGARAPADLEAAFAQDLELVVHDAEQIDLLESVRRTEAGPQLWLKADTGMHRLGIDPAAAPACLQRLEALPWHPRPVRLMTHLACADEADARPARAQLERFAAIPGTGPRSAANSAALLRFPDSHLDWVRPGLMLYGVAPVAAPAALRPVMTLDAPLLGIRACRAGDRLGYGATFVCPRPMRVGLVEAGYADGYPHASNGRTAVAIDGTRHATLGRVSMDLLAIDLARSRAAPGDRVELWGPHVGIQEVAGKSGTIAYELMCRAGQACQRLYDSPEASRESPFPASHARN